MKKQADGNNNNNIIRHLGRVLVLETKLPSVEDVS